jgi:hypothetical protein
LLLLLVLPAASAGGGRTELVSVVTGGNAVEGDSSTYGTGVSASGRFVLFVSNADNLPGSDGTQDVYRRDRKRRTTKLVSESSSGEPANDNCHDGASISADGRFVAFSCSATNLGGNAPGIFVRDLKRHRTKLVSKTPAGDPADGSPQDPAISTDGRFVAFEANSTNLPGSTGFQEAYVRDLKRGRTELVTQTNHGDPLVDNTTRYPQISGNGRFVAFWANSDSLPGGTGTNDVYLRDLRKGKNALVSKTASGTPGNGNSVLTEGAVSADGRFVAFRSSAPNLGGTNGQPAFLKDMKTGKVLLVSRTAGGAPADGSDQAVSSNGRYVAFDSFDDDLPGQPGVNDVYRFDRRTKRVILLSRSSQGTPGDDESFYAAISAKGDIVSFSSRADNLSTRDDDSLLNTFVRIP